MMRPAVPPRPDRRSCRRAAFTLVELAVALVVIGLIAGGILAGQEMIQVAEDRAVMREIQEMDMAVHAFRQKYHCLPGDCPNATSFFGAGNCNGLGEAGTATCNGDGDGLIQTFNNIGVRGEPVWAVHQLASASLFTRPLSAPGEHGNPAYQCNGTGTVAPGRSVPELRTLKGKGLLPLYIDPGSTDVAAPGAVMCTYFAESIGNRIVLGGVTAACDTSPWNWWAWGYHPGPAFPVWRAARLDRKFDDGRPRTGRLQSAGTNYIANGITGTYPNHVYVDDADGASQNTTPVLYKPGW
jgi:prepilin-type N-terminal cleavage/methylation domain-containing protein